MERIYDTMPIATKEGTSFMFDGYEESDRWRSMVNFLENPYWRRVWIIQELALGVDVQLVCRPKTIPFRYLAKTLEVIKTYGLEVTPEESCLQAWMSSLEDPINDRSRPADISS